MDARTADICNAMAIPRLDMSGIAFMNGCGRLVVLPENHTVIDAGIVVGRHGGDPGRVEVGDFGRRKPCIQKWEIQAEVMAAAVWKPGQDRGSQITYRVVGVVHCAVPNTGFDNYSPGSTLGWGGIPRGRTLSALLQAVGDGGLGSEARYPRLRRRNPI
jgi:hypothetical protein